VAILLGGCIGQLGGGLFIYIQSLYAFFAPPFAAVFLLGILWKRINAPGALLAVLCGFALGIALKIFVQTADHPPAWITPYANQATINWFFCVLICVGVSLLTTPPRSDQVTDQLTVNWRSLNLFHNLGNHWYTSVVTWWALFVLAIVCLFIFFSGITFPTALTPATTYLWQHSSRDSRTGSLTLRVEPMGPSTNTTERAEISYQLYSEFHPKARLGESSYLHCGLPPHLAARVINVVFGDCLAIVVAAVAASRLGRGVAEPCEPPHALGWLFFLLPARSRRGSASDPRRTRRTGRE